MKSGVGQGARPKPFPTVRRGQATRRGARHFGSWAPRATCEPAEQDTPGTGFALVPAQPCRPAARALHPPLRVEVGRAARSRAAEGGNLCQRTVCGSQNQGSRRRDVRGWLRAPHLPPV